MRFRRVAITNFRILRDVEFDFSLDEKKRLTVLRAQNESGKTTLLMALQWVLYGESALPGKKGEYRLHPLDWSVEEDSLAFIEVVLEFETNAYTPEGELDNGSVCRYLLERSVEERVNGNTWERMNESLVLSEFREGQYQQIVNSETVLRNVLPSEMREIFFTDGDRALSFIEADVSTQRRQVKNAVKSMLGLNILEKAISHLRRETNHFESEVRKVAKSVSLDKVCSLSESTFKEMNKLETEITLKGRHLDFVESELNDIEVHIHQSLKKGNKQELRRKSLQLGKEQKRIEEELEAVEIAHCGLYKTRELPLAILSSSLTKGYAIIDKQLENDLLPNATITVMKELHESASMCLCGESLSPGSKGGKDRLKYLEASIEKAISQGKQSRTLGDLKYIARQLHTSSLSASEIWRNKFHDIFSKTNKLIEFLAEKMGERRELDNLIESIPNVDVSVLVTKRKAFNQERDELRINLDRLSRDFSITKKNFYKYESEKKELIRNEKLNAKILAELEASQDLLTVFLCAYATVMNKELQRVSDTMNQYFMEMIGASSENERRMIVRSEITQDYDIKVYGPNNRSLNPDRDLNGASRRALTISLILALTTVSEIKAPNIIDTPLGMMSGHVKRFVTDRFIKYSSQPVLFLTRDEIAGCEDIISQHVGSITTFTNPAHYPKSLKNKPLTGRIEIMTCACNHNQYCEVCERIGDESKLNIKRYVH